jgi:hypothetical protein
LSDDGSILGIIFPLSRQHIDRFFDGGKTVFVKFFDRQPTPSRLHRGAKLFFYQSGGGRALVGDAEITEVSSGTLDMVWNRFGERLFLTKDELEAYVGDRQGIQMTILVLEDARKYAVPLTLSHSLTMAGQYMTKQLHRKLNQSCDVKFPESSS